MRGRFFVASDLHEIPKPGEGVSSKIQSYARKADADAILVLGDLLSGLWGSYDGENVYNIESDGDEIKTVNDFVKYYKIGLDNLTNGEIPVYCIPGNHDGITHYNSQGKIKFHEPLGEEIIKHHGKAICLEGMKEEINGIAVGGVGGHREIEFGGVTPLEYSELELWKILTNLGYVDVLLTHTVPHGTKLDVSSFVTSRDRKEDIIYNNRKPIGVHCGSLSVRKYIEEYSPLFAVGGHIHESGGRVDKIGTTLCANVAYKDKKIFGVVDFEKNEIEIKKESFYARDA
ncbi:MAG TPA: hypothetical protein ENF95_01210 [Candidatus Aenigmarchaeota archaeon]|nr:hypothetical protein [Candidatus Aenigmarchaeota archaeon]